MLYLGNTVATVEDVRVIEASDYELDVREGRSCCSRALTVSCPLGVAILFTGQWPRSDVNYPHPSTTEVNVWSRASIVPCMCVAWWHV
jgi:hypothetical protein